MTLGEFLNQLKKWAAYSGALLAAMILLGAVPCRAQEVSATLYGTVTDPAGAAIPEAGVTITNPATGHTVSTKTGGDGSYQVTSLPVGTYTLTVEHPGFEKSVQTGIKLDVFQKARMDAQLRVGAITTTVEVAASAPLVETATATVGAVVDTRQVVELPLNIRRFGNLPLLFPGSVPDRGGFSTNIFGSPFSETTYASNGARGSGNNILIDGVDSKNMFTGGFSVQPSVDAVQEFKVQTQSFSAVFGKNSGSTINLVTKSGTNEIHGSAFEFLRNDKLDARNFFDQDQADPITGQVIPGTARASFRRNQFGGYIGGPIRKNKTFIFGGYEALRHRKGLTSASQVPTLAMRGGDFGELLNQDDPNTPDGSPAQPYRIYDPLTCANPIPGIHAVNGCQEFPNNMIPANRIDPVALKVIPFFPTPNAVGDGFNFVHHPKVTRNDHQFSARVDHTFGPSDNLYVRYILGHSVTFTPEQAYSSLPQFNDKIRYRGQNIALSWTHTFSPTILNEFRFGFSRNMDIGTCAKCPRAEGFVESFGIANMKALSPEDEGFPWFGFGQGYEGIGDSNYRPVESNDMVEKFNNTLTITKGKHTLAMGTDYQPYQSLRDQAPFSPHGQFAYEGLYSNHTMADFLLGYPDSAGRSLAKAVNYHDGKFINFFFQDDWRVTQNFSLNIGLRYEHHQLPTDRRDVGAALMPIPGTGIQVPGNAFLVVPGYAQADKLCADPQYTLDAGLPTERHLVACADDMKRLGFTGRAERSLWIGEAFPWAPRFGFAWRPTSSNRLVLRGGYGLFAELSQFNGFHYGFNNPIQAASQYNYFETGVQPPATTATAFASGGAIPLTDAFLSLNVSPSFKQPFVHEWTFNVQSELSSNTALEVRYLGISAIQMSHFHFFGNQAIPGLGDVQPRRLYPDFGLTVEMASGANSNYNSLQAQLTRKMSHGLSFLAGYTWAKQITNNEGEEAAYANWPANLGQNDNQQGEERARGVNDARQRFVFSSMFELPFGRGKKWASNSGRLVNGLIGGWEISTIVSLQTGFPVSPAAGFDVANTGTGGWRPDRVCPGDIPAGERSINRWFDASCFTNGTGYVAPDPVAGTPEVLGTGLLGELTNPGGRPRFGNSGRNVLDGPGFQNWDFGFLKDFRLTEKLKMQFRAEFFNAFNQAHFDDPSTDMSDSNVGKIFGASEPRNIQFGLKFLW